MIDPAQRLAADQAEATNGTSVQPDTSTSSRPGRRRGIIVARMVAVALGLLLPLLVLEVALRLFGPFLPGNYDTGRDVRRHPVLGHYHTPNFRGWVKTPKFTVPIAINPMGFRDPRQSYAKPPGTFRILVLGDSYVEAQQVPLEQSVTALMERSLSASLGRPVEVINGGVFAYGTTQEYLLLDHEGVKYEPDLVLLFFCHCNDIANNNYRLELNDGDLTRALKPYFDLEDDEAELRLLTPPPPSARTSLRERLSDNSMLYNVIETGVVFKLELPNPREPYNAINGLVDPTRGKWDAEPSGEWERAWRITDLTIEKVRDRAAEAGAPLMIVGVPSWRMLERDYWQRDANKRLLDSGKGGPDAPIRHIDAIADRLGVPHLDLRPAFQPKVDDGDLFEYYIEGDYHWTAAGHVVAAEATAAFLAEQGMLPR